MAEKYLQKYLELHVTDIEIVTISVMVVPYTFDFQTIFIFGGNRCDFQRFFVNLNFNFLQKKLRFYRFFYVNERTKKL